MVLLIVMYIQKSHQNLTDMGEEILPILKMMEEFGKKHGKQIDEVL